MQKALAKRLPAIILTQLLITKNTNPDANAVGHKSRSSMFSKDQTCREMQKHGRTMDTLTVFKAYF